MSSRSFRRILAGLLVTAFLSPGSPVFAEAAGLPGPPAAPPFWAHAWQWLAEQVGLAEGGPEEETESDAGWMLDPDG